MYVHLETDFLNPESACEIDTTMEPYIFFSFLIIYTM